MTERVSDKEAQRMIECSPFVEPRAAGDDLRRACLDLLDARRTLSAQAEALARLDLALEQICDDASTAMGESGGVARSLMASASVRARARAAALREAAQAVMAKLEQYGPAIVPHLLDTDDNDGQRLRGALLRAAGEGK